MDSAGPHSFINPTTCFTIACVAFSLVAISTIWRNQAHTGPLDQTAQKQNSPVRPRPARRQAVDSLYFGPRDISALDQSDGPPVQSQLARLVLDSAKLAQMLRSRSDDLARELLGEVSQVTTALCCLQRKIIAQSSLMSQNSGMLACISTALDSLDATFKSLDTVLNGSGSSDTMNAIVQQLRSQKPLLEFLLSQVDESALPPTPPAEAELEKREPPQTLPAALIPHQSEFHMGITPGVDEKCWIEPPPEYSPPTSSSAAALPEKSEQTIEHVGEEVQAPEREDGPDDDEGLYEAVTQNNTDALAELLEAGAEPSVHVGELQRTALHQAAHLNHCTCLAILLRHGAVMSTEDARGDTAVHLAAWAGNVEALSTLLSYGADLDWLSGRDGYSPLWCAVSAYQIDAARLLLRHGARVSLRSASGGGLTPLHQAAVTGQGAMCELLLERGAQADCLDDDLNTPLHCAAASGSVAAVKILLANGAEVDARQVHGLSAAHWAAHKGHTDVLGVLRDHGARLDGKAEEGATPLHLAANRGHTAVARMLLDSGVDRSAKATWDGHIGTPAAMAKARGHVRLAKILRG